MRDKPDRQAKEPYGQGVANMDVIGAVTYPMVSVVGQQNIDLYYS